MTTISCRHNEKSQTDLRKSLRNNATTAESLLWLRLKGKQVEGLKFRRQYGVGPYVLDFYNTDLRLDIELDGEVHQNSHQYQHDTARTLFLNRNNISVLRYSNEVVYHHVEAIIEDIKCFKDMKYNEILGVFFPSNITTKAS